jgi:hypothetical protein
MQYGIGIGRELEVLKTIHPSVDASEIQLSLSPCCMGIAPRRIARCFARLYYRSSPQGTRNGADHMKEPGKVCSKVYAHFDPSRIVV